ncbi:MAG TPA: NUDIX hydrolase [Actinospica sp.]|jgi:8-oxo-dGTP diphosphatase|nr:NUDIX hydrolase [Actinospica sp.]
MTETTPETARMTADVVLFGEHEDRLYVLLIERGWDPYAGHYAVPGGHVDVGEGTVEAAHRELLEETGLRVDTLNLVGVYAAPGRDPRGRYVDFAYTALLGHLPVPTAGDDARAACWVLVDDALSTSVKLAFDHERIIHDALHTAL